LHRINVTDALDCRGIGGFLPAFTPNLLRIDRLTPAPKRLCSLRRGFESAAPACFVIRKIAGFEQESSVRNIQLRTVRQGNQTPAMSRPN